MFRTERLTDPVGRSPPDTSLRRATASWMESAVGPDSVRCWGKASMTGDYRIVYQVSTRATLLTVHFVFTWG